jgi:hypothetical protein
MVSWCESMGISMKGHPAIYFLPPIQPAWIGAGRPTDEQLDKHFREIISTYGERIKVWDVINEPVHNSIGDVRPWYNLFHALMGGKGTLVCNEYEAFSDTGYPAFFNFVSSYLKSGTRIDVVGLQGHDEVNSATPLGRVIDTLNGYKNLGKPIHITELSFPTNGNPITRSPWRGKWDEATHAKYVCDYYRTCFSHPSVENITWWDFADGPQGSWRMNTGLLRADGTPKAAYTALKDLICNKWMTKGLSLTAVAGKTTTSKVFRGKYKMTVTLVDGTTETREISVDRGTGIQTIDVTLGVAQPASAAPKMMMTAKTVSEAPKEPSPWEKLVERAQANSERKRLEKEAAAPETEG